MVESLSILLLEFGCDLAIFCEFQLDVNQKHLTEHAEDSRIQVYLGWKRIHSYYND